MCRLLISSLNINKVNYYQDNNKRINSHSFHSKDSGTIKLLDISTN